MMKYKREFPIDTRVIITGVPENCKLYWKTGTVMGKSFVDIAEICDEYIILLDEPKEDGTKCIVISERYIEGLR